MASCTSTPATRMSQRLPPAEAVLSFRTALVLMRLSPSYGLSPWLPGASSRRGDRVVDDARGAPLLEALALRLDGVLRVDGRDHAGLEDPESGADRRGHQGRPAERCRHPVVPERHGAERAADGQGAARLEQAAGLAGAQ